MAIGNYGTVRPAKVSPTDVEIFYTYTPSRNTPPLEPIQTLDPTAVLTTFNNPNDGFGVLGGLYNLNLPAINFSDAGFYSIIIRPRQYLIDITDCGVLSAFPDIKGLVFDIADLPSALVDNGNLVGYRLEYTEDQNTFRIITSSNRAEAVNQNLSNTSQKAVRYRFNDSGNLIFCTLTPSSASNVKPNETPFIGTPGEQVILTNTFFNPTVIELEMVEHDIETLAYGLFGNQSKSITDGKYTIYDFDNNIYKQYNLYEIQDEFTNEPLFEIREEVDEIDDSKDFDDITNANPEGGF